MIKFIKNALVICALLALVVSTSGCFALLVGAAAGAASAVYVKGDLEKNFDADLKSTHQAVLDGLKSKNIFVTTDTVNVHDATVLGEFEDGEKINVSIKALTEKTSKIKVRVGMIGNEAKSVGIMNAIEKEL